MTARDLIAASLRKIGVLAPGEGLQAQDAQDALIEFNLLLSNWSTESLAVPERVREQFALIPGQQTYTMGSSGDFDTTRPLKIESVSIRLETSTPAVELPVDIVNQSQWASIVVKETDSPIPSKLFPEGAYPLERLNLWGRPNAANKLVLWSWKELAAIASLDDEILFPPGYGGAIVYNLAIGLAPDYGKEPTATIVARAVEYKANIKRMNIKPRYLRADDALLSGRCRADIFSGGSR